ncbi:oxidoreductase [Daedalea quercina L-15889]|uniref:Oxidoreductase n=1 Tax=Daedalea quercina L-15889 TaxID=1314783 RepID=A0A165TJ93_9APHY|nr:oxidoreductase [Daedalea quercina L-15889]
MTNRVVIVTGCSKGGIGYALSQEFAAQGCRVYATARRVDTMGTFEDTRISTMKLDVTSASDVSEAVKVVLEHEGRVDMIVNNAARPHSGMYGPLAETSLDDAWNTFDTNVFGVLRLTQAVFPHMAAKKSGVIVNIGSIVGDTPAPWGGIYGSTKAALGRLSEILYMEVAPFNIRVMHVSPGGVKSNIATHALNHWQLSLREDSFYKPWFDSIARSIDESAGPLSITAEQFAKKVVKEALKPNPPRYMTLGAGAFGSALLQWLPRAFVCWLMWQLVGGEGLWFLYGLSVQFRRLLRLE